MTCPVHAEFDPLSEAFLRDPLAEQPDAPVFYAPSLDYYVVDALRRRRARVPGP